MITGLGGRRAFVVAGGFDAWRSSGLKVGSKYAKNALEGLGEDTSEAASSFTQKIAGSVKTSITSKKPTDALVPFVGLVAVVAAVVNYKTALEYAGVIGIELTILAKLLSYESPWAFFDLISSYAYSDQWRAAYDALGPLRLNADPDSAFQKIGHIWAVYSLKYLKRPLPQDVEKAFLALSYCTYTLPNTRSVDLMMNHAL